MKRIRLPALAAFAALVATAPAFPANLYALIYANTEDEDIGCIYDVVNMGNFLLDVQKETGLVLRAKVRMTAAGVAAEKMSLVKNWAEVAEGWSRKDLDKDLKAINPGKDDVFLFYYSGHGGRMSDKDGRWPDMALPDDLTDLQYPVDVMSKKATKARFMIAMGDCCNNYMDRSVSGATKSAKVTAGLKKLFLEPSGVIVASSSEPGQYSLGGEDGGVFTNAYIKAAYNPSNDNWESVLRMAQTTTARNSDGKQKAQFELQAIAGAASYASAASSPPAQAEDDEKNEDECEDEYGYDEDSGGAASAAAYLPIVRGKASGSRKPGSSPYPFVELVSASLREEGADLVLRMQLKSIPKKLPFNDKDLPADSLEYEWAAYIDIDGDASEDFSLGVDHFKYGRDKRIDAALDEGCSASLFVYDDSGGESIDADIETELDGDSLVVRLLDYEEYFEFEKGSAVFFSALYYRGGESSIP